MDLLKHRVVACVPCEIDQNRHSCVQSWQRDAVLYRDLIGWDLAEGGYFHEKVDLTGTKDVFEEKLTVFSTGGETDDNVVENLSGVRTSL